MDLIQDNAMLKYGSAILCDSTITYRLILGVHVRAKGGDRSIIASISGTVTRIWQF